MPPIQPSRPALSLFAALLVALVGTGCETPDESSDDPTSMETESERPSDHSQEKTESDDSPDESTKANESEPPAQTRTDSLREASETPDRITDPEASESRVAALSDSQMSFATDIYGQLRDENPGANFFYSPYSLSTILSMAYAGAEESSESQLGEALHLSISEETLHPAANALALSLQSSGDGGDGETRRGTPFQLRLADAVWGQSGFSIREPYLDTLVRHYGAGLKTLDFRNDPESARETINRWVAQQTDEKIEDLLPDGSLDSRTRLVLTDAIYFEATWANTFDEEKTEEGPFTTLDGETVQTPMMHGELRGGTNVAEGDRWTAVELPYVGGETSMVAILPDEGAFEAVEEELSVEWLNEVFGQLEPQALDLTMPRFELESAFSAKSLLGELGVKAPFDPEAADFTGIAETDDLFLTDVVHKAYVSVDEEGTEAAAASGATMGVTSMPQYREVSLDRPFVFAIRHRETGTLLFVGRVTDPT